MYTPLKNYFVWSFEQSIQNILLIDIKKYTSTVMLI